GIVIGAVVLAGTAVMGFPPEGYDPLVSPPPADRHPIETLECAPGEMIRRKSFWLLYAMGTCTMMAGMGVISSARSLVLSIAPDAALGTVAFMAGILSVASAAGRVFTGFLNDIVGVRANIRISSVAITAATLLVMCAVMSGNLPFLAVSFALCGFSCGMCIPAAAVVTAKLFGARHYQVNLEIMMSCGILHAFAATFVGAMYDAAGTYVLPVLVLALTGFLGAVCSFRIRKP
ncbi:MAG: MFS transporter, partial [Lachnospiraceae bacterium]|nr:MFS transporter [Lachnospiraceae bacterium]